MSNPPERRSKRLAASSVYDEQDGDFIFSRASKRTKTTVAPPEPEPPAPVPVPAPVPKKGPGRPPKKSTAKRPSSPAVEDVSPIALPRRAAKIQRTAAPPPPATTTTTTRRTSTRRKESLDYDMSPPPQQEEPLVVPRKRASVRQKKNDASSDQPQPEEVEEPVKKGRKQLAGTPKDANSVEATPGDGASLESRQIALPFSDTPIIARNREMRKNHRASGGRRSSLGMRGRRASSLMASGHSALPHREVDPAEFYKHIEADGLSEPRRMKQLLTWCAERSLSEKPPHGSHGSSAVLGARAIQDQLLKDFGSRSEFSNWFERDEAPKPTVPTILKPNPRNLEHEAKIAELEARVERLKIEKKTWQALAKPLPQAPPLYPDEDPTQAPLPDEQLLSEEDMKILNSLTEPSSSFAAVRRQVQARVQQARSSIEFRVDELADRVHKLDQRVVTASRQADRVLNLSSTRLKAREEKEKLGTGTKAMPTMEVLRSLSRILPEGETGS